MQSLRAVSLQREARASRTKLRRICSRATTTTWRNQSRGRRARRSHSAARLPRRCRRLLSTSALRCCALRRCRRAIRMLTRRVWMRHRVASRSSSASCAARVCGVAELRAPARSVWAQIRSASRDTRTSPHWWILVFPVTRVQLETAAAATTWLCLRLPIPQVYSHIELHDVCLYSVIEHSMPLLCTGIALVEPTPSPLQPAHRVPISSRLRRLFGGGVRSASELAPAVEETRGANEQPNSGVGQTADATQSPNPLVWVRRCDPTPFRKKHNLFCSSVNYCSYVQSRTFMAFCHVHHSYLRIHNMCSTFCD